MILKPDKRKGIVLINKSDHYQSLEGLFGDRKKFQVFDHDPILTSLCDHSYLHSNNIKTHWN